MKIQSILFAGTLAIASLLPLAARSADDKPAEATAAQTAPATAMKPHSHMEEKTGMPQKAPAKTAAKKKAADDKSKHSHPRDAK
jgi:hypothetical protein